MGSSKSASKSYRVIDYYMSSHFGIAHGPLDAVIGIWVKERDIFPGTTKYDDSGSANATNDFLIDFSSFIASLGTSGEVATSTAKVISDTTEVQINLPQLFGGDQKEGGCVGAVHYLAGRDDQIMPENLAAKLGLTSATCPGFRGFASLFFHGGSRGFLWGQNNPYLPGVWTTSFRRSLCALPDNIAVIRQGNNPPDSNPAHMIFECLTSTRWGMGADASQIDIPAFTAAAQTLYDEGFGLSMTWVKQSTIQEFINEILDHIMAYTFIDPRSGLYTIKLARADYDADTLRILTPDNCDVLNPQRKAWGETINEITITWTNPTNNGEEAISFQDLANIAMQGGVVAESRTYYGIRNSTLAAKVGTRDIRSASAPLFTCDVEMNREFFDTVPGDVFKLHSPEDGIENLIMRVVKVDYGKPGDQKVLANLIEDVFGLEAAEFVIPPVTGWVEPGADPAPMANYQFVTSPLPILIANGLASTDVDDQYPRVTPMVFAQQNGSDTNSFHLWSDVTNPTGAIVRTNIATMAETARSQTTGVLLEEFVTTASHTTLGFIDGWFDADPGELLFIGSSGLTGEIVMIESYNASTGVFTLARGVYDTIPRAWPVGTPIWYVDSTFNSADVSEIASGQTVSYQLQSQTSRGLLPLILAPTVTYLADERPYQPFRPANVKVDSTTSGLLTYSEIAGPLPATIPVSWSNRNRMSEDQVVVRWTEGNVTPETGQTTTIRLKADDGTVIAEHNGLTGTTYNIPIASFGDEGFINIHVLAVRAGHESYQNIVRRVRIIRAGYSRNYGENYGQ